MPRKLLTLAQTCRERDVPGTSTLVMPRRVGVRSHRFIPMVLLLVLPLAVLLVLPLAILLVLLLVLPLVVLLSSHVGHLFSHREISGSRARCRALGLELCMMMILCRMMVLCVYALDDLIWMINVLIR